MLCQNHEYICIGIDICYEFYIFILLSISTNGLIFIHIIEFIWGKKFHLKSISNKQWPSALHIIAKQYFTLVVHPQIPNAPMPVSFTTSVRQQCRKKKKPITIDLDILNKLVTRTLQNIGAKFWLINITCLKQ